MIAKSVDIVKTATWQFDSAALRFHPFIFSLLSRIVHGNNRLLIRSICELRAQQYFHFLIAPEITLAYLHRAWYLSLFYVAWEKNSTGSVVE